MRGILPYHIYSTAEIRVVQQKQGNGLPQVVTGYDPDPLQTILIQSVPQQLVQPVIVTQEDVEQRKTQIHRCDISDLVWLYSICCGHVKLKHLQRLYGNKEN